MVVAKEKKDERERRDETGTSYTPYDHLSTLQHSSTTLLVPHRHHPHPPIHLHRFPASPSTTNTSPGRSAVKVRSFSTPSLVWSERRVTVKRRKEKDEKETMKKD
ncbi:hypothetical protein E2C01_028078 [Portunus trituberculatus]|uniref:Uncharacterized protein n=1 Tax=Portunus trituberculatus TaxID=210409 RepID=A0A5B7EJK6_PORTR|nr:hypothetical protein [Portunus trituberculatus]